MTEAWRDLSWAIEAELCGVTDRYRGEGPDGKWCGRGDGVRYVKAPLLPARAMGEWGRLDMEGYRVLWALNRIEELASLARIAESRVKEGGHERVAKEGVFSRGQQRQWDRIIRKCTALQSPIGTITREQEKWKAWVRQIRAVAHRPWEAMDLLECTAEWAEVILAERKCEHQAVRERRLVEVD